MGDEATLAADAAARPVAAVPRLTVSLSSTSLTPLTSHSSLKSFSSAIDPADEKTVKAVARRFGPGLARFTDEELEVSTVSGGITNILIKVAPVKSDVEPVLVRVFGDNTEVLIDRQAELTAIRILNQAGFGARLLGLFDNGRVEGFIDMVALQPEEMTQPEMAARIASRLREFHKVVFPGSKEPRLWHQLRSWLDKAKRLEFTGEKKELFEKLGMEQWGAEIEELAAATAPLGSAVVFSHNDLLSGNIMYSAATGELQLIDFEYGCYNYRGFDIGNHFNEYAGFECDYSRYPDREAQYQFFRHYLHDDPAQATEAELFQLYKEVNLYALASHMFWGIWSVVQARYSPIDFDYIGYARQRWDAYFARKAERFALLPLSTPPEEAPAAGDNVPA